MRRGLLGTAIRDSRSSNDERLAVRIGDWHAQEIMAFHANGYVSAFITFLDAEAEACWSLLQ